MSTTVLQGAHNDLPAAIHGGMVCSQGFHAGIEVSIQGRNADHAVFTR
jgi:hypothetical protein